MPKDNPLEDHTSVKRRRMLKSLGLGAAAFGMTGGTASAATGTQYPISNSESLSDGEVSDQLAITEENDAVRNYTNRMADQGLDIHTSDAVGVRLHTENDEVNARNPNLIQIPYSAGHGEAALQVGLIDDDSGARISWPGFGTSLVGVDGETRSRYYLFDEVYPYVEVEHWLPVAYPICYSIWPIGWGPCYPAYCYWEDGQVYVCERCWDCLWYYCCRYWPWRFCWDWYCHPVC